MIKRQKMHRKLLLDIRKKTISTTKRSNNRMSEAMKEIHPFLRFDIFEEVLKKIPQLYLFKAKPENSEGFFTEQVNKILLSKIFILELEHVNSMHSIEVVCELRKQNSGAVTHLCEIIKSTKWINAWLTINGME